MNDSDLIVSWIKDKFPDIHLRVSHNVINILSSSTGLIKAALFFKKSLEVQLILPNLNSKLKDLADPNFFDWLRYELEELVKSQNL